jgi:hypothetical protein
MEEKKNKTDFELLLVAGLKKALEKMLDYKIRMGQEIAIADDNGRVIVMKAEDYAKTLNTKK